MDIFVLASKKPIIDVIGHRLCVGAIEGLY